MPQPLTRKRRRSGSSARLVGAERRRAGPPGVTSRLTQLRSAPPRTPGPRRRHTERVRMCTSVAARPEAGAGRKWSSAARRGAGRARAVGNTAPATLRAVSGSPQGSQPLGRSPADAFLGALPHVLPSFARAPGPHSPRSYPAPAPVPSPGPGARCSPGRRARDSDSGR